MNDTPLSNATVDELLSADLDGDFDAAARDLGMTPEDARAQLAQTPGIEARRRAMRAARDALALPPPEIDEVSATRLRAAAVAAAVEQNRKNASTRRRHQRIYAVAGIAAALAGVVALVAVVSRGSNTSSKSSAGIAAAAAPSTRALPSAHGHIDFGTFGDQAAFAQQLRTTPIDQWGATRYAANGAAASAPNLDKSAGPAEISAGNAQISAGNAQSSTGSGDSFSLKASNTTTTLSCADATARAAAGGRPVVQGTAVVGGRPVQVTIVARAHDNVAIVLAPDCSLVEQLVVP